MPRHLLIKVACFVKKKKVSSIFNLKPADLNLLVQGCKLYLAFPFSKGSLPRLLVQKSWSGRIIYILLKIDWLMAQHLSGCEC